MSSYVLSAVLTLKDQMTAKLKSAASAVAGLGKSAASVGRATDGIGKAAANIGRAVAGFGKSAAAMANLRVNLNAGDLARVERLKSILESAGFKPINIRANDSATSRLQKIKAELQGLVGKQWQIAVNIKGNAKAALGNAKNRISEGLSTGAMMAGATVAGLGAVGGLTYGVADAFKSQMEFEKKMSSVKAILSGSYQGAELDATTQALTAKAEELGATTKFTAAEVAQGMYYQGMAGWKREQILAGIKPILDLASAGNAELAATSDIYTDSLTAFGLKAGETANFHGKRVDVGKQYADLFAALITNANTDVLMSGETLKYAAPLVQAMYAKGTADERLAGAEDLMLVTGLMANAGIKGSQAGTSSRAMFTRLSSQNRNAYFAQNALGVDFVDEQTGEVRRLKDIVKDFRKVFNEGVDMENVMGFFEQIAGEKIHKDTRRKLSAYLENIQKNGGKMSGAEMMKMTAMLAGQEAMSGWLATFLASEEDFEKLETALANSEGAAERMAKIQLDNLAGDITILASAWDAFQRNLVKGDASAGLREFTQAITDTLSKANELFKDGIDFGDFGAIIIDVIAKLKAKFLELDGIGSLLAGGTLVFGLRKILQLALKVKDTLALWSKVRSAGDVGDLIRGKAAQAGGLQSVGAMNIRAGTVSIRAGSQ